MECRRIEFQSTHPHGVRQGVRLTATSLGIGFNPRTHTGCDSLIVSLTMFGIAVSIHAPTRGATFWSTSSDYRGMFQSTHPHGVRLEQDITIQSRGCFNPRTHTGCDRCTKRWQRAWTVSIHAPTRGATRFPGTIKKPKRCFNPRTHTGCDPVKLGIRHPPILFQSTHPHGVRHITFGCIKTSHLVSIHAPTRGATGPYVYRGRAGVVSIHAPTRGATRVERGEGEGVFQFQSTHPHGVRQRRN